MNTLYWITRLDGIVTIFVSLAIMSAIGLIFSLVNLSDDFFHDENNEKKNKKLRNICSIIFPISIIIAALIPSTQDAYVIYGIGGTIDYLKNNKDASQIPDKTLKAINLFLDNQVKTDSINKKEKRK